MFQIRYASFLCSLLLAGVADAKPPAGTLNIPLTVNQEQRYVVGVNMVSTMIILVSLIAVDDD